MQGMPNLGDQGDFPKILSRGTRWGGGIRNFDDAMQKIVFKTQREEYIISLTEAVKVVNFETLMTKALTNT